MIQTQKKAVLMMTFAPDLSIGELDIIIEEIRSDYGYALSEVRACTVLV